MKVPASYRCGATEARWPRHWAWGTLRFTSIFSLRSLIVLTGLIFLAVNPGRAGETDRANGGNTNLTELPLDELINVKVRTVFAASKYTQNIAEAPASVSIVTAEEIKLYGHRTLADVLRSVRGLNVTYDRNYSHLGVRGFNRPGDYNTRVLLLVDGHRMNDNIYDSALIGTEGFLDVDLIDRIEVVRGPGSSLFGDNAFFGVINLVTRRGRDVDGMEVTGEAGSFDTYKGRFTYGKKFRTDLEMLLSGSFYDSQGPGRLFFKEYNSPGFNNGVARHVDDDRFYSTFASLGYHDFTLEGGWQSREKGIPTGAFGTVFNDPRTRTFDRRGFADLAFERSFADVADVTARVFYDRYEYDGHYLTDLNAPAPPPDLVLNQDLARGEWWGTDLQATKKILGRHTLTVGTELRDNFRQDQANFNAQPFASYLDDRRRSINWGAYAQGEFLLRTNLILNAGLRFDRYDTFGNTVNPRGGLIYRPVPPTTLRFLAGTAFRAPNAYELYYNDGGLTAKPSPDLRPERNHTYEVVWEQQLAGALRLTSSGFYYRIRDLITQQKDPADGLLYFANVGRVEAVGTSFELEHRWDSGIRGRASYLWQQVRDISTGETPGNSPRHLGKFNLIVPVVSEKVFTGFEVQYSSGARTLRGDRSGGYWVGNVTLFSQKLIKNLEFSASVYNLFDRPYGFPGSAEHLQDVIPQDGRSFRVKLTYRF